MKRKLLDWMNKPFTGKSCIEYRASDISPVGDITREGLDKFIIRGEYKVFSRRELVEWWDEIHQMGMKIKVID